MRRALGFALALAVLVASSNTVAAQGIEPIPQGGDVPLAPMGADAYGGVPMDAAHGYGAMPGGVVYEGGGYEGGAYGPQYGGPQYGGPQYGGPQYGGPYGGEMMGGACPPGYGHGGGPGFGPGMDDELWNKVHKPNRWYMTLNYTGLELDGMFVPVLATTSPPGTLQATAGQLPDAEVLFGNEEVGDDWRNGGEIRVGWWLVDGQFLALEGHYLATETESTHFNATSSFAAGAGFTLARPYFDFAAQAEDARILAFDDFNTGLAIVDLEGSIDIDTRSDLQSAGLILRHVLWADFERNLRVDILGGYRFFNLDESLVIRDRQLTPPVGLLGAVLDERTDIFDTENEFHGGEIGLDAQLFEDNWTFQLIGKCALGNMHQVLSIDGRRDLTSNGATATTVGGLLAQPSNIGEFSDDEFAVIPEGAARIHYSLFSNVRIFAGYRVAYLSEVLRPGDQIDRVINESQFGGGALVGDARPAVNFNSTSAWLQGMDAGVEIEW